MDRPDGYHQCGKLPPEVRVLRYESKGWPDIWALVFSLRSSRTYDGFMSELYDITHCPYCGERLGEQQCGD